jgi:hypothetical protein
MPIEPEFDSVADLCSWERRFNQAIAGIAPEYFQLPVAGADASYRERVYAYELYHQLRLIWGDSQYSLSGEVDKTGNPFFRGGPYARSKPDLLVHIPGLMTANLLALEIKAHGNGRRGWLADLRKLTWFVDRAQYAAGYFLVYGAKSRAVRDEIRRIRDGYSLHGSISVWSHASPGNPAEWCGRLNDIVGVAGSIPDPT